MISSARQGCAKTVSYGLGRPSWSLALHAESSAQALLRATAPPPRSLARPIRHAHTRARFSAAAAAVHLENPEYDEIHDTPWHSAPLEPMAVDQSPPLARTRAARRITPEVPLVKFRRLITNDPLESLLALRNIPPDQLWSIALVEFDVLLSSLRSTLRHHPLPPSVDFDDIHTALVQLRGAISDHPQAASSRQTPLGKRYRRFVGVCLQLGDRDLVRSIWRDMMVEVARNGMQEEVISSKVADVDRLCEILADDQRDWRMLLWMFDPSHFPDTATTSTVLERYLQAHLATHRPEAILALFHRHAELGLKPTPDSYNHLLQAMLELGNMDGARAAAKRGREEGGLTKITQQLAILRGHRALGAGTDLEERVLSDLRRLGEEPDVGLINALIRLRVNDADLSGADRLLGYFGLDETRSAPKESPTPDSAFLALKVAGRAGDLPRVRHIWSRLCETPAQVTDAHLSQLIYALDYDEGYNLVKSQINPEHSSNSSISIPTSLKPGIRCLNALLDKVPKRNPNIATIHQSLTLLPRLKVKPNAQTVKLLLELLSNSGTPPIELAALLHAFLRRYPDLQPTMTQVNTILSSSLRAPHLEQHLPSTVPSTDSPLGGISSADPLHRALAPFLDDLRKRDIPSNSETLAIRLRYDALTHASAGGIPSANAVWDNILERGYRPNRRHILALMSGYADSGAMVEAETVLRLAKDVDVEPTNGMWMTLLTGWARVGDLKKARHAYKMVESSQAGVDIVAVCAMITAYGRAAEYAKAAEMVHRALVSPHARHAKEMDQQALLIAVDALRANNEETAALELAGKYRSDEGIMSADVRRVVREIRNWLGKRLQALPKRKGVDREAREIRRGLEMCDWILDGTERKQVKGHSAIQREIMKSVTGQKGKRFAAGAG